MGSRPGTCRAKVMLAHGQGWKSVDFIPSVAGVKRVESDQR